MQVDIRKWFNVHNENYSYQQINEYINSPIVPTNRLIVECYLQQKASGIKIATDSIPHYRHGDKDMSFYSPSNQTSEQNMPKL